MENTSKYDDTANLLTDLCKSYSFKELRMLTILAAQMQRNKEFSKNYMKHLKLKYIRTLLKIQNGTYKKVPFSALHKEILSLIKETPPTGNGNLPQQKSRD